MTQGRRPGRPRKGVAEPPSTNICDLDLETLERFRAAASHVVRTDRDGRRLVPAECERLAEALAAELVYVPPLIGLHLSPPPKPYPHCPRRGPQPKTAQVVFMARVAVILADFGIHPREWASGQRGKSELSDWCQALLRRAGLPVLTFSERQRRQAMAFRAAIEAEAEQTVSGKYVRL